MAKLFIFGIGGTGARVIKSLTMLLASGVKSENNFEIVPIIIDPHKDNEDLKRTVTTLNNYQRITDKVGIDNGFFGTKISTLQSLDNSSGLAGTYTFKLKEVQATKFKDYFSYNSLESDEENQAFAKLIFSGVTMDQAKQKVNLLDIPMDIGFIGNPNVGSVVLNQFKHSEEFKTFSNSFGSDDRIFIISSIFGGTGAAGFPTILKSIRDATEVPGIAAAGFLKDSAIGALTVLPYFNITVDENSPINKSDFIEKTKAALHYYIKNVNPLVNSMYYAGDNYIGKGYENDPGQNGQKNKAHFVEVAGALAIIDFMNTDKEELLTLNGRPTEPKSKEFGIKNDNAQLSFSDLGDTSRKLLGRSLIQFTLFKKYLDENLGNALEKKFWSSNEPKIDEKFISKPFYDSNFLGFLKEYTDWFNELEANDRSFKPFDKDSALPTLVKGVKVPSGFLGLRKFNYDKFDVKLNTIARRSFSSAEQKFIKLFFDTTAQLTEEKYGY